MPEFVEQHYSCCICFCCDPSIFHIADLVQGCGLFYNLAHKSVLLLCQHAAFGVLLCLEPFSFYCYSSLCLLFISAFLHVAA